MDTLVIRLNSFHYWELLGTNITIYMPVKPKNSVQQHRRRTEPYNHDLGLSKKVFVLRSSLFFSSIPA